MAVAAMPTAIAVDDVVVRPQRWRRLFRDPGAVAGLVIVIAVAICALFSPWLTHVDPNLQDLNATFTPPGSPGHLLGTDNLGRDLLARIIWGSRVSATVGLCVVAIGGSIGVSLGLIGGYFGGWIDAVIGRTADIQLAFPLVLLAVAVV